MINYTERLDRAIRRAAWAHEQSGQHRKGTDIPYIIHPVGVMLIAGNVTSDEDILIACLFHDIIEDVATKIYCKQQIQNEFGERVLSIICDVTKDESIDDWRAGSNAYLHNIEHNASNEAVIVCAADKIHNLLSTLSDHNEFGDSIWQRFTTKSAADQLWWYTSVLDVITKRNAPIMLRNQLAVQINKLKSIVN